MPPTKQTKRPSSTSKKAVTAVVVADGVGQTQSQSQSQAQALAQSQMQAQMHNTRAAAPAENVILKLRLESHLNGITHQQQQQQQPDPYNVSEPCPYTSQPQAVGGDDSSLDEGAAAAASASGVVNEALQKASLGGLGSVPGTKLVRLLAEFEEKSKNGEWPLSTSVHCYWCCHRFPTPPVGLPIKMSGGRFHVIGCFCSLECACTYNFSTTKDSVDECLSRYSLINALSKRLGLDRVVHPAPDRLSLLMFGGHMTIDEFRGYCAATCGKKQLVLSNPPMQSVTLQVEEVNESDVSSEYRYIPLDTDRVSRYQEKVRLTRSKPLVNFKNTLDHSMKLKYGTALTPGQHPAAT